MFEKKLKPVAPDHMKIQDRFWKEYMELIRNHVEKKLLQYNITSWICPPFL